MSVKTQKEKLTGEAASPVIKDKNPPSKKEDTKKVSSSNKIKMFLKSVKVPGDYICIMGKETIKLKNGIIEIDIKDTEKFLQNGFIEFDKSLDVEFGTYFCEDYRHKTFELMLDDNSTISIKSGKVEPKNKWQKEQLEKRHFKLWKK